MSQSLKAFRTAQLDTHHSVSLSQLSSTPQSSIAHAASLGLTQTEAQHRLSILVDQQLASQAKGSKGQTLDSYVLAS